MNATQETTTPAAIAYESVNFPSVTGDECTKRLPVQRVAAKARVGMTCLPSNEMHHARIVEVHKYSAVVEYESGRVEVLTWPEVMLSHVEPDLAESGGSNTPSARLTIGVGSRCNAMHPTYDAGTDGRVAAVFHDGVAVRGIAPDDGVWFAKWEDCMFAPEPAEIELTGVNLADRVRKADPAVLGKLLDAANGGER